jgi:hypothetical protein
MNIARKLAQGFHNVIRNVVRPPQGAAFDLGERDGESEPQAIPPGAPNSDAFSRKKPGLNKCCDSYAGQPSLDLFWLGDPTAVYSNFVRFESARQMGELGRRCPQVQRFNCTSSVCGSPPGPGRS